MNTSSRRPVEPEPQSRTRRGRSATKAGSGIEKNAATRKRLHVGDHRDHRHLAVTTVTITSSVVPRISVCSCEVESAGPSIGSHTWSGTDWPVQ